MKAIYRRIIGILIVFFCLAVQAGYAQSSLVTAEVDRAGITDNDLLTLTLTITHEEVPRVTLPPLDKFATVRTSRGSQMVIFEGDLTTQRTYHYLLRPLETGTFTIGPIEVVIDGQTFHTDPIMVEVTDGGPAGSNTPGQQDGGNGQLPSEDFFVEAEIDNAEPYLGEQVIYTHRLFTAFTFSEPNYDYPRFSGFWAGEEPIVKQRSGRRAGRRFSVRETKIVLFPTRTGGLTIDETIVTARGNSFNSGFILPTEPITLEVQALPTNAPPDFEGAVGLFTLDAEVSNEQAKVDEPITLLAILTGQGNINTAPDPIWPDMPEWRVFDAQASTFTDFRDSHLIGRRVYERLMVPGLAGRFIVPPITYTYFDPDERAYRTISSDSIEITVAAGAGEAPPPMVIGVNKEEIERIGTDIRHIKSVPPVLATAEVSLTTQRGYWWAWGAPVVLLLVNFAWSQRQRYLRKRTGLTRSTQAYKRAKKSFAQARKAEVDLYIAADQILTTYLADKLNQPVVGLTQDALADLLTLNSIASDLIEQTHGCLTNSDLGRFGPGGSSPNHAERLLDETEALIADLERVFI